MTEHPKADMPQTIHTDLTEDGQYSVGSGFDRRQIGVLLSQLRKQLRAIVIGQDQILDDLMT